VTIKIRLSACRAYTRKTEEKVERCAYRIFLRETYLFVSFFETRRRRRRRRVRIDKKQQNKNVANLRAGVTRDSAFVKSYRIRLKGQQCYRLSALPCFEGVN